MQYSLLLLGVLACSTSVILIKKCDVDPVFLTALRLLVAAVALTPVYVRDWLKHRDAMSRSHYTDPLVPGLVLAVHFFAWIIGARLTSAVNSTLLVNLVTVAMPLPLIWLANERINRKELIATIVATLGLAIIFSADYRISTEFFRGDLICLGAMLLMAFYLALGRRYRHHPTIWLYVTPLYYYAAVASFAVTPLLAKSTDVDWSKEWPWVLGLGLVPTVIGHSLINNGMRHLRGQVVGLANMLQFVFAGVMAYYILAEPAPEWTFYPASVLILAAGVIVLRK